MHPAIVLLTFHRQHVTQTVSAAWAPLLARMWLWRLKPQHHPPWLLQLLLFAPAVEQTVKKICMCINFQVALLRSLLSRLSRVLSLQYHINTDFFVHFWQNVLPSITFSPELDCTCTSAARFLGVFDGKNSVMDFMNVAQAGCHLDNWGCGRSKWWALQRAATGMYATAYRAYFLWGWFCRPLIMRECQRKSEGFEASQCRENTLPVNWKFEANLAIVLLQNAPFGVTDVAGISCI